MNNDQKDNAPLTVLVIEDHPDQRDLLAIVLQREGYRVITAANGVEALEKLETENVQIALSDIMMPKMDGFELIKRIRSNAALKTIYLILITARIQEGDRIRGLDLGADDYITKPFSFSELLARIRVGSRVVQYQQHLEYQTQVDSLTGLFNRRAFEKKIHEAIRSCSFGTTARPFTLTVSIGVSSTSVKFYSDWRELLDDADRALYVAKNSGKDRIELWEAGKKTSSIQTSAHP